MNIVHSSVSHLLICILVYSLIFDDDIKVNLLDYVSTTMLFSDKHVDSNVVAWNR